MKNNNTVNNGIVSMGILLIIGLFLTLLLNIGNVASAGADGNASYNAVNTSLQIHYNPSATSAPLTDSVMKRITNTERMAAAIKARNLAACSASKPRAALNPGGTPDYFGTTPNYANSQLPTVDPVTGNVSGGIRKFVDSLPGLTPAGANDLGQYIPIAVADTISYPGADYYVIGAVTYTEKMHADLKPTILRGYVQLSTTSVPGKQVALYNPDGTLIKFANGAQVYAVDNPHYLGPAIVAQSNRPVRVKFINLLPTGEGGDLFLPVDTTVVGAGAGPNNTNASLCAASVIPTNPTCYAQNRVTIHLHGGLTPWISDGSQDMWTTPAGENTQYPTGVSTHYVPDMDNGTEPQGTMTFYYINNQSARLMFYHDHPYGITRLNVYAGIAAPYVLRDSVEAALEANGTIPGLADYIPLVIQDKTFLPDAAQLANEDPTWPFALNTSRSDLWFPSVYMPNQNPALSPGDSNPMGRWDYGPWTSPPVNAAVNYTSFPNPLYNPSTAPWENQFNPGVPQPSIVPEAFVDTPVINGNAISTYQLRTEGI